MQIFCEVVSMISCREDKDMNIGRACSMLESSKSISKP